MVIPHTFNFAKTPSIHFGVGVFETLPNLVRKFGKIVLIVTGGASLQKSGRLDNLLNALYGLNCHVLQIAREPSPETIDDAVLRFGGFGIDVVVGIGGGSAIDAAKAISAMLPLRQSVFNYLEGVGASVHSGHKIPYIAVPTTAGTGSEATKNAVLSSVGPGGFKKSIRHDNFVPDIALIDPALTLSCPPNVAAACAMDAFTQLMESYVSIKASPMTDSLAIGALKLAAANLEASCSAPGNNLQAKTAMSYASAMSGITLANAGLGVVHGLASSIGAFFEIPHGVVCGTLVGAATSANIRALRAAGSSAIQKFADIGSLMTEESGVDAALNALMERLNHWTARLNMQRLGDFGVTERHLDKLAAGASNKESPVKLGKEEIVSILYERL